MHYTVVLSGSNDQEAKKSTLSLSVKSVKVYKYDSVLYQQQRSSVMHKRHQFRCKPAPPVHHIAVQIMVAMMMRMRRTRMTLILFMLNALGPVEAVENFLSMCVFG